MVDTTIWDTESEWDAGTFTDTVSTGSVLELARDDTGGTTTQNESFNLYLESNDNTTSGTVDWSWEIRDTDGTGTILHSNSGSQSFTGPNERFEPDSTTIDIHAHNTLWVEISITVQNSDMGITGGWEDFNNTDHDLVNVLTFTNSPPRSDTASGTDSYPDELPYITSGGHTTETRTLSKVFIFDEIEIVATLTGDHSVTATLNDNSGNTVQVTVQDGTNTYDISSLPDSNDLYIDTSLSTTDENTSPTVDSYTVKDSVTPPTNLSTTGASDGQIDLSWDPPGTTQPDHYDVYRAESSGTTVLDYTQVSQVAGGTTTYSDTGLENGEQYYYVVTATWSGQESGVSNEAQDTTTLPGPTLDSLDVSADDITASWTKNDNSSDGDYLVEHSTDGGSTYTSAGTEPLGTTTHEDTELQDTTTYTYRITRQTDHATAVSNTLDATTEEFTFDSVGSQSITFSYQDPDSFTQTGFKIYREQDIEGTFTSQTEIADVSDTTTTYTDSNVIPGNTYRYTVEPYDASTTGPTVSGTTTALGGDQQPRVSSSGWSVSITHPVSGRVIRPDVIDPRDVQFIPGPNALPRIRIPVRRAPEWLESEFDDNPAMSVYLDGKELPIDELVNVEHPTDRTVLVGEGGAELRTRVQPEYDSEQRPVAATDLVNNNTTYTTVDNTGTPPSDTVNAQDPSGESELGDFISFDATDPLEFTGGGIKPLQVCFTTEAESYDNASGSYSSSSNTDASDGSEVAIPISTGNFIEFDFTTAYDIPASEFIAQTRVRRAGSTSNIPTFWVYLDGVKVGEITSPPVGYDWITKDASNPDYNISSDITAGSHTLRIEVNFAPSSPDTVYWDVVAPADNRYSYTLDNTVNTSSGWLDGPELYRPIDTVFDAYQSAFSITDGSVSATINDTSNDQALALSNDGGSTYEITGSNTTSISGSFTSAGASLTLKATLSHYEPSGLRNATPRTGYDAQRLDAYDMDATVEFESLLIDQEFDNQLWRVLNQILPEQFAWKYSIESGTPTVTVDEPGSTTADSDPELSDAQIDKQLKTYSTVVIKGSSLSVSQETFQASTSFIALNQDDIVTGSEAVYDSTGTQFSRDTDYEMNYGAGEIKILSGGDMVDTNTYNIDYRHTPVGTHTVSGATGDTLVRTVPGVVTDRQAEQIAYVLAEVYPAVSKPRYAGDIIVPRLDVTFDPLKALELADLDLPDAATPISVRGDPELAPTGLRIRLGTNPTLDQALGDIAEQVGALSDRV